MRESGQATRLVPAGRPFTHHTVLLLRCLLYGLHLPTSLFSVSSSPLRKIFSKKIKKKWRKKKEEERVSGPVTLVLVPAGRPFTRLPPFFCSVGYSARLPQLFSPSQCLFLFKSDLDFFSILKKIAALRAAFSSTKQ